MEEIPETEAERGAWVWRIPAFIIAGVAIGGAIFGGFERLFMLREEVDHIQWSQTEILLQLKDLKDEVHALQHPKSSGNSTVSPSSE